MFDLFVVNSVYKDSWLEVSGRTPNVAVTAGKTEEISLTAARSDEALVYLKVELEKSQSPIDLSERDIINIQKESDGLYFHEQKIKDIYLVLNSNANFTDSSFKNTLEYFSDSEGKNLGSSDLKFKNDVCSIKDFLMNQSYFKSNEITISKGDISFFTWLPHIVVKASNNSNPGFDPSLYDSITKLTFTKSGIDGESRYICNMPISSLNISTGNLDDLENGDTVVVVLYVVNEQLFMECPIRGIKEFYYMQQSANLPSDPQEMYSGNQIITIVENYSDELNFVLPLNGIQDIQNKPNIMFFFDKNSSETSLDVYCVLSTMILKKSYVFAKTSNPNYKAGTDESPWRFEFKYPLNETLEEGADVTFGLEGNIYLPNVTLNCELVDGAYCAPSHVGESDYYHPLSDRDYDLENGTGNVKSIQVNDYTLSPTKPFVFKHIINIPAVTIHNYYFQCTTPYLEGYSIITNQDWENPTIEVDHHN